MTNRHLWWVGSNVAYLLAGLWTEQPVFAGLMFILAAASAYYHAGGEHGNHFDVAAIYAVLFYLIGIHWGVPVILLPVPALVAGLILRMRTLDVRMEVKVAALIVPLMAFGLLSGGTHTLLYALLVLVVALGARQWVDHGLWHVLSAYGLALVAHGVIS